MILDVTNKREVFWDDYLIDTDKTTAESIVHQPREAGIVMECNEPWEGNMCDFYNILKEPDGLLRMYYLGWELYVTETQSLPSRIQVCYAESRDNGLTWVKPQLGLREFEGSFDNNIILDNSDMHVDNFMVFRDENPACPPEERYKGIALDKDKNGKKSLICFLSPDGIHFKRGWVITEKGAFDTLNTAFWDAERGIYHCYIRGFHGEAQDGEKCAIRDIRYLRSTDFKNWSEPELLDFGESEDYPLYTNCVSIYERAPQILIGFPTRYMSRGEWTSNYDRLCGREARRSRMRGDRRYGLAVTDCVFMCSRDGQKWFRPDEAFMRPGPEYPENWLYGNCYPAIGIFETDGLYGTESELQMFAPHNHFINGSDTRIMRYTIRKDGFMSRHAKYSGAVVVTKPFVFGGKGISINFSTSARGYLYITLTSKSGKVAKSCELFGDSCDRIVDFDVELAEFAGEEVVMEIKMKDADIYSVKFD